MSFVRCYCSLLCIVQCVHPTVTWLGHVSVCLSVNQVDPNYNRYTYRLAVLLDTDFENSYMHNFAGHSSLYIFLWKNYPLHGKFPQTSKFYGENTVPRLNHKCIWGVSPSLPFPFLNSCHFSLFMPRSGPSNLNQIRIMIYIS